MTNNMNTIMIKAKSKASEEGAFYLKEQPIPKPEATDLLIKIVAIGMNPVDTKIRTRTDVDKVIGWDAFGIVEEVGEEVSGFNIGDKVFYAGELTRPGCNSEYQLVDYRIAAHAPQKLSPEDSAAMPLTSLTAWEALFVRIGLTGEENANKGKSILIIGGAGGVGSIAIQLAKWSGLKVFATASRPETTKWCKKMGADHILNHSNDLFEELKSTETEFVDTIFCTTQMEKHWEAMAKVIAPQGKIALIDDPTGPVDIRIFKQKSVSLCWEFMYTRSMFNTDEISDQGEILSKVSNLLNIGILHSTRQITFQGLTPENIQKMHLNQESGSMIGKQVLALI